MISVSTLFLTLLFVAAKNGLDITLHEMFAFAGGVTGRLRGTGDETFVRSCPSPGYLKLGVDTRPKTINTLRITAEL
jgi:hypothetical protein